MFFILSKILNFLLSPFNWCVLLLLLSWFIKTKKYKKKIILTTVSVFILFSNTYLFQKIVSYWEYPITPAPTLKDNNLPIVILGGLSSYDDQKQRIHFNEAADRLLQALPLHQANPNRKLIISGGSAEIYFEERPEADYLNDYLLSIGVEAETILFETKSRNTHENARNTATLLNRLNIERKVILITSAFHIRRAVACFEKQGFQVTPYAAHAFTKHQILKPADYFMPSLNTLTRWPIIIKEWLGLMVYKIKGFA